MVINTNPKDKFYDSNTVDLRINLIDLYFVYTGLLFSSGLGATTAITHMLSAGDHIVAMDDLYGGMWKYSCSHGLVSCATYV